MSENEKAINKKDESFSQFVVEQYSQYWQMYRFHLSLSWNIPSIAIVVLIALFGLDPERLEKWSKNPLVPAILFLLALLFSLILVVHHGRNLKFADRYEKALEKMDKEYGVELKALHNMTQSEFRGINKLSSSTCLSIYLILLCFASLGIDIFFWTKVIR